MPKKVGLPAYFAAPMGGKREPIDPMRLKPRAPSSFFGNLRPKPSAHIDARSAYRMVGVNTFFGMVQTDFKNVGIQAPGLLRRISRPQSMTSSEARPRNVKHL